MSASFYGINVASNALRAFQFAMYTTSHNIANVNTPGYSRQTADFTEGMPNSILGTHPFTMGGGVDITSVTRIRDQFLAQRYAQTTADDSKFSTLADNLKLAEASLGDLSSTSGISSCLDNFFNAFQALSANPSDTAARTTVKQAADALASRFRSVSGDLASQQANVTGEIQGNIASLNALASQVATLNRQIVTSTASGGSPNDLMDQRDQLVSQMSQLADIRTNTAPDGSIQVFLDQHTLVDQGGAKPLGTTVDVSTGSIVENGRHIKIGGGQIGGDIASLQKLSGYAANLDTLATNIVGQVNAIHSGGYALDGTTGHLLFAGTGASTFDLSDEVKQSTSNIVASGNGAAGDGSVAQTLSDLRNQSLAGLGGTTIGQYYVNLSSGVGSDLATANAGVSAQEGIRAQIEAQIQSTSGVSLDDEMANMLQYQRSYEASARVLQVMDSVLNDTITMLVR